MIDNSAGYQSPGLSAKSPPRPLLQAKLGAALIFEGDYMLPRWAMPDWIAIGMWAVVVVVVSYVAYVLHLGLVIR